MSKKKKDKWIEEEDFVIPIFPSAFNSESTAELEFTFVVNNKFKELFKRAKEATRNDNFVVFFDNERTKLLTNLIYNINFDTMKIHKSSLDNNEIPKEIKKSARISLKGKKTGKENIYEKNITPVFPFRDYEDYEANCIRTFQNLADRFDHIIVESIYERAEEVYCVCSYKTLKEISKHGIVGMFLGTFGDVSKNIDVCVKRYSSCVLNSEGELINSKIENNRLILDLSEYTNCCNISDKPHEIKIVDISTVWKADVRIGINKSLFETVEALVEMEEAAEQEGLLEQRDRIEIEMSLLAAETNFTKIFLSNNLINSHVLGYLREYQEERLISKISNPILKEIFKEERDADRKLYLCSINYLISRFTKVSTVGFNINEQDGTVEWILDAEICGFDIDKLKEHFNGLLVNSSVSEIEFTLKEYETEI